MIVLLMIAVKSLLVAGATLGLLAMLKRRSAAERSCVAHVGLFALIIIAFAPLVLPRLAVPTPALFHQETVATPNIAVPVTPRSFVHSLRGNLRLPAGPAVEQPRPVIGPNAAVIATAVYALPATVLLLLTLIALLRLFALRARAEVLIDGHWLSALARAQRRMGFKHGTALLTSDELASPISWGLVRPVILLNSRAIEAAGEAEAIIAHELAHVARMDWIKLLLARLATAMFWFNPLVWLLSREAHQLREEAADDSVLDTDIVDTDYAQLLVGVARHECPGLLLGAHGVAPSKSSLARRIARVLDGSLVRGPVARSFAVPAFVGAILLATPLAALTVNGATETLQGSPTRSRVRSEPEKSFVQTRAEVPGDLAHLIANGVSASVSTASAAIIGQRANASNSALGDTAPPPPGLVANRILAEQEAVGSIASIEASDSRGHRAVAIAGGGAGAINYAEAMAAHTSEGASQHRRSESVIDSAIEMKAIGVTPEFASAIRLASPALRNASLDEIVELKAIGVTPDYVRELVSAGFPTMDASQIGEARAVRLDPGYMRAMRSTGVSLTFDDLIELQAMRIQPDELVRMRAAGPVHIEKLRAIHGHSGTQPPRPRPPPRPPSEESDAG